MIKSPPATKTRVVLSLQIVSNAFLAHTPYFRFDPAAVCQFDYSFAGPNIPLQVSFEGTHAQVALILKQTPFCPSAELIFYSLQLPVSCYFGRHTKLPQLSLSNCTLTSVSSAAGCNYTSILEYDCRLSYL